MSIEASIFTLVQQLASFIYYIIKIIKSEYFLKTNLWNLLNALDNVLKKMNKNSIKTYIS